MSDSPKTFFESLNERFNSTFVVSFFFYVILFNWKALVYLINTDLIPEYFLVTAGGKISKLDFVQSQFSICRTFWFPLLFAVVSIFILPLLNWGVSYWRKYIRIKRENANRKQEYGDLSRITEDWQKLYDEKIALDKKYSIAIGRYRDAEIERDEFAIQLQRAKDEIVTLQNDLAKAKVYIPKFNELSMMFSTLNKTALEIIAHPDLAKFEKDFPHLHRRFIHVIADIRNGANRIGLPDEE